MNNRDLLLTIDCGSQSLRAMIFNLTGDMLAIEKIPLVPHFSRTAGWAEQDPDMFWRALGQACKSLWYRHTVDKPRIAGVALTTQRGTVINVNQDGQPLRPAILWQDRRTARGLPPLPGLWGCIFRLICINGMIERLRADAEMNWIRTQQNEVWKKTHKYLLLSGYLTHKLTDTFVDSTGCQVGYLPFDYKRQRWAGSWDWKWRALPVDPARLPDLHQPGQILGEITRTASRETGIPVGLPLVAAAADKACEILGSGGLRSNIGCVSYGTASTIGVIYNKYIEPVRFFPAYPAAVPECWAPEIQMEQGFGAMMIRMKKKFGLPDLYMYGRNIVGPEMHLNQLAENIPPGSDGLLWSVNMKLPGAESKDTFIGYGDHHTEAHYYRAILEGTALALRQGKELLEKKAGIPITELRASGGGSQSRVAIQILSDVFGLPVAVPHTHETSGLGAAIDLAVGLDLYGDFETAVRHMSRTGKIFKPDPETSEFYEDLYSVYVMYKQKNG